MAKSKSSDQLTFFRVSDPYDPIDAFFCALGNKVANLGIVKLGREAAKALGLNGMSAEERLQLDRVRLSIIKQEGENQRSAQIGERQIKLLDLKIQEKEIQRQQALQRLEAAHSEGLALDRYPRTEIITGALEVTADPEGLVGDELDEGYTAWLDSLQDGKVIVILGRRGSGKTALACKIAEYAMARFRMPLYWCGLPSQARDLLPHWVSLVDSPEQCPLGSFIIIDEAGLAYLSLAFNTPQNQLIRKLLMIARHRHCSLVFAVQSSRDMEYSILRQADTIIFKQPSLHQPKSERPDLRSRAQQAATMFSEIPKEKRTESAFVFDDDFEGLITSSLPSFWSEKLSSVYASFDLTAVESHLNRASEIKKIEAAETKLLNEASTEKDIMELRRQGHGIEKIAKILGITTWQVRKCLEKLEG